MVEQSIEQGAGPEKRIHAITPQGYQVLQDWFEDATPPEHQRDELFLKLMLGLISGAADPYRAPRRTHRFIQGIARDHDAAHRHRS